MTASSKDALRPPPLSEQVYERMIERIKSGSWAPGEIFDRRSLAKELGVSIAPVGEAMIRLEHEGFIENMPRKGTRIRRSDPKKLYESLILREAIECQAARLLSPQKLAPFAKELERLAEIADGGGLDGMGQRDADAEFHKLLVSCAGIAELSAQHSRLLLHILFDEIHLLSDWGATGESHKELLRELRETKSPEAAAERIRKHLRSGKESILRRFEQA